MHILYEKNTETKTFYYRYKIFINGVMILRSCLKSENKTCKKEKKARIIIFCL